MILYGKKLTGELDDASHYGSDAQNLQLVLAPVHDAIAIVSASSGGTITLHGISPADGGDANGDRSFTFYTAGQFDALRDFLDRDRSGVGSAGYVIE